MKIARVVGTVVTTISNPSLDHHRLLLCAFSRPEGEVTGETVIAVDTVGAGAGETVLVLDEGNSARQVLEDGEAPVRAVVVGIVDHVAATEENRQ